jgi:asparagine synthase (glutamine-hydrolysing)
MCGIFALLNNVTSYNMKTFEKECFLKGASRGPESSIGPKRLPLDISIGFHRLAINGLDSVSNQPITHDNITLICNGEIYNYHELFNLLNIVPITNSDCEIIIHLYKKYGIEYTLNILDGVFAFVLIDNSLDYCEPIVIIARDPYGVRPLYMMARTDEDYKCGTVKNPFFIHENIVGFASEMKVLQGFFKNTSLVVQNKPPNVLLPKKSPSQHISNKNGNIIKLSQFEPGSFAILSYKYNFQAGNRWSFKTRPKRYSSFGFGCMNLSIKLVDLTNAIMMDGIYEQIRYFLGKAVEKRVLNTDRPVACLLSGGLDSSLVTALACKYSKYQLETYSIGMIGSPDLANASKVANFLGTKHTEVVISEDDFFDAIPDVIYAIESYDTTTVRASVGNYLIGKYISEHSEAKVILNGDGADELMGGYLYFHEAPDSFEFDAECRRLLSDIHQYDVLRSDRCIASHGLEPRTPFLDREWVQFYLSIPTGIRNHTIEKSREKYLVRAAFKDEDILPKNVLWRRKEAFSDGVSSQTKPWFEVIQDRVQVLKKKTPKSPFLESKMYMHLPPQTDEQLYYRNIYESFYPNQGHLLPYFWMPKYVEADDASARTLNIY